MTPQDISNNTKYQDALARADAKGVAIVARYTDKAGAFLGCQVRGSEGDHYCVTNEANSLTCDCIAGKHGNYCYHRAIVTRAEMERAAQAAREVCVKCGTSVEITDCWGACVCQGCNRKFCPDCWEQGAYYCDDCMVAYIAAKPEPIMARNDSGPRLYRTAPVLAERVREVM
jgi:hypothetical protein